MALLTRALLRRWLLLAVVAQAGCYSPHQPACAFSCVDDGRCPSGFTCGTDGVCHRDDTQGTCEIEPQVDGGGADLGAGDGAD